ncbi:hypothetical protein BSKO_12261 [Bryopsis sp. KO-2023]|nr:hypothetical protein BSKO_12261 [Bryopsis sp. KO-2023]
MTAGLWCSVFNSKARAFRFWAAIFTLVSLWNAVIAPTFARELLCSYDGGGGTSETTSPPMLIGIGAQKSGSSMIFSALSQHPQIVASRSKEVHFFSTYSVLGHSLDAYLKNWDDWENKLNQTNGGSLFEFTPRYLATSFTPCRIRRILPNAKFIVTLREPIARANSALNMNRGYTYLAVKRGQPRGSECARFAPWDSVVTESLRAIRESGDACVGTGIHSEVTWKDCGVMPLNPISRGLYCAQISWWFRNFDPSQFIFVNAEDLKRLNMAKIRQNQGKQLFKSENPEVVGKKLSEFYEEPNQQLYRFLAENGHNFSEFRHNYEKNGSSCLKKTNYDAEISIMEAGKLCCTVSNSLKAAPRSTPRSGGFMQFLPADFCLKTLNGQEIEPADFGLIFGLPQLATDHQAQVERLKLRLEQEFPLGLTDQEGDGGLVFSMVLLLLLVVCGGCRTFQKRAWKSE